MTNKKIAPVLAVGFLLVVSGFAQQPPLPLEISEYYQSINYAAAYSTLSERLILASKESSTMYLSLRLQKVVEHLGRVQRIDGSRDKMVLGQANVLPFVAPQLVRISTVYSSGSDRYTVSVRLYDLSLETNLRLVASFDRSPQNPVSQMDRWTFVGAETHEWYRIDGHWQRSPASIRLLNDSSINR